MPLLLYLRQVLLYVVCMFSQLVRCVGGSSSVAPSLPPPKKPVISSEQVDWEQTVTSIVNISSQEIKSRQEVCHLSLRLYVHLSC